MDTLHVIDVKQITLMTKKCLDRFAFLGEASSVLTKSDQPTANRSTVKAILTKLHSGKLSKDDVSKSIISANLRQLVNDVLLNVVSESLYDKNLNNTSSSPQEEIESPRHLEAKVARTIKTFNKKVTSKLTKHAKELAKLIDKHTQSIKDVKKSQEKYWTINSKYKKYQVMVETAVKSREHLQTELPEKELRCRDKAMKEMEASLKKNESKTADALHLMAKAKSVETNLRNEMQNECSAYKYLFSTEIKDRVQTGLDGLKTTVKRLIHNLPCRNGLLQEIEAVDVEDITESLITACSWTYCYPESTAIMNENGFEVPLPDPYKEKACTDIFKPLTEKPQEYVDLKPNSDTCGSEFLEGKKGSHVKRKVTTQNCNVEFGWKRKIPFGKKKYGFFKSENVSSYQKNVEGHAVETSI